MCSRERASRICFQERASLIKRSNYGLCVAGGRARCTLEVQRAMRPEFYL